MISYKNLKRVQSFVFVTLILILSFLIFHLLNSHEFINSLVISESISLIIALISLIIAYFSFAISIENKRPLIIITLDFNSRYQLVQLNIENKGEKTARNIRLEYSNSSIWKEDKFKNLETIASYVSVLSPNQVIKKMVGIQQEIDFTSQTTISVSYSNSSGYVVYKDKFLINLNDFKNSASFEDELTKTLYELQKIPTAITKLKYKRTS